ncbi:hypothetical protein Tcan_09399 [Toxocara canis]|uniref:Uncharacterized protein n=1 Tax=Toxocara canis TaxID=6265 RepID=A0A0B2UMD8_TOXCA|nr:hypothetical protein Tcan_09399 [Toxocara canis]
MGTWQSRTATLRRVIPEAQPLLTGGAFTILHEVMATKITAATLATLEIHTIQYRLVTERQMTGIGSSDASSINGFAAIAND